MFSILDYVKLGSGAVLGGILVFGWMSLFTVPAAERVAHEAGVAECKAAAERASLQERERQQRELMRTALEDAAAIRREADRSADFRRQIMELAHDAISSADADACHVNVDGVRSIAPDLSR